MDKNEALEFLYKKAKLGSYDNEALTDVKTAYKILSDDINTDDIESEEKFNIIDTYIPAKLLMTSTQRNTEGSKEKDCFISKDHIIGIVPFGSRYEVLLNYDYEEEFMKTRFIITKETYIKCFTTNDFI